MEAEEKVDKTEGQMSREQYVHNGLGVHVYIQKNVRITIRDCVEKCCGLVYGPNKKECRKYHPRMCLNMKNTGTCKFGVRCRYRHQTEIPADLQQGYGMHNNQQQGYRRDYGENRRDGY